MVRRTRTIIGGLVFVHRWLSVVCCLLFAMWFASGAVMHFVPFPAPSEAARFAGLAPIAWTGAVRGPGDAVKASGLTEVWRVKLIQRSDGPIYLVSSFASVAALHAADLSAASVQSSALALAIAKDYAAPRQWDAAAASVAGPSSYDQWTMSGDFDRYRPLYRIALGDRAGTEIYVSAKTGEVVLDTTRHQRIWNYAGSVAHWIYPTALRSHPAIWSRLLWWLSLLASIGAAAGALLGLVRLVDRGEGPAWRGWRKAHHWLGLACAAFVLTWICSGFLSMDDGLFFSTGTPTRDDISLLAGAAAWSALPAEEIPPRSGLVREVEWFSFNDRLYRRARVALDRQELSRAGAASSVRLFLRAEDVAAAAGRLGPRCESPEAISAGDDYPLASVLPGAPVYRVECGQVWFDVDSADGELRERLDPSRRTYRWLFQGLHRLDFPALTRRPALRTTLIVLLCACGVTFSMTGILLAWRRVSGASRQTLMARAGINQKR